MSMLEHFPSVLDTAPIGTSTFGGVSVRHHVYSPILFVADANINAPGVRSMQNTESTWPSPLRNDKCLERWPSPATSSVASARP
jgi:hypothetical protein